MFIAHARHRTSVFSLPHIKFNPFSFVQSCRQYSVAPSASVNCNLPLACIAIEGLALNIKSIQKLVRHCAKNLKPQTQMSLSKGQRHHTLHNTSKILFNCLRLVPSEAMSWHSLRWSHLQVIIYHRPLCAHPHLHLYLIAMLWLSLRQSHR